MIRAMTALFCLAAPQAALAAESRCVTREEVSAVIVFSVPPAIEAVVKKCGSELGPASFINTGSRQLVERFQKEGAAAAASIGAIFRKIIDEDTPQGIRPETAAALLRDVLGASVTDDIETKDCGSIDDLLRSMEPMPAANFGMMLAALMSLTADDGGRDPFNICPPAQR